MKKFEDILLLTDLDGTLLNSDGEISEGNCRAAKYFTENGGRFALATGRNRVAMEYFVNKISTNAPCVVSNGAVIYDFHNGLFLDFRPIGETAKDFVRDVMQRFPDVGIEVFLAATPHIVQSNSVVERHCKYVKMPHNICEIDKIPEPWLSVLLARDPEIIGEVFQYVWEKYKDKYFIQYTEAFFIEIMEKGANKGSATLRLAQHLGIKQENIYAVGDGTNDVQLLTCTKNAYAPMNCCDEVRKLDVVFLPDNNHDAIAALINILDQKM